MQSMVCNQIKLNKFSEKLIYLQNMGFEFIQHLCLSIQLTM